MELKRILKAVASQWVVVVAVSLVGVVAALVVTEMNNQSATTLYEATTAIAFEPVEGETIADLADEIQAAQDFAVIAAEDLLAEDPDLLIVEDLADARLEFIAQGATEAEAGAKAQALLQSFLETDPTLGEPVVDLIEQLEEDAAAIQVQIDALDPGLTPQEQALVQQHDLIDKESALIQDRLIALSIEEAGADSIRRSEIQIERSNLQTRLQELQAEKSALPDRPTEGLTVEDQLLLTTLQRRMDQITTRYEQLYLRQLGVTGSGEIEPVTFTDLTPEPSNPWVNGFAGLFGGLLMAVGAVGFLSRTRQTVWLRNDVAVPVLGEVPARRVGHNVADDWYDKAEPGPRKTAIQALRSVVEAQVPPTGTTIGLTRHETSDDGARALAVDLAASMATAGKSVLLIDADFSATTEIGRYKVGGTSLSRVLKLDPAAPEFQAEIEHATESAYLIRPGLAVVPSGPLPESPADKLAGPQFRELIASARERYDIVMVVVDDLADPAARVPLQRVEYGLVAITPGRTTMPDLNGLLDDAHRLRITMLGAIFLGEQDRLLSSIGRRKTPEAASPSRQPVPAMPEEGSTSPIFRLQSYPIPDERRSALVPHSHLRELAEQIEQQGPFRSGEGSLVASKRDTGPGSSGDDGGVSAAGDGSSDSAAPLLAEELLDALANSSQERAFAAVADYLVSQTEDMVTARYGFGDYSEELIETVAEHGFISMRPLRDHKTVASWLKAEIEREADQRTAASIIEEMERVVSKGRKHRVGVDDWLAEEFFRRHLTRTDGQPTVWHLSSPGGTIGILVPALRLNRKRVESLIESVASVALDELVRLRDAAFTRGDIEQADMHERRIEDAREFKMALEAITYGSEVEGRDGGIDPWIPDWSLGLRANLAVFQGAGLLPFPALSDEELAEVPVEV